MPLSGDECRRLIDAAHARAAQIGTRVTVAPSAGESDGTSVTSPGTGVAGAGS